MRASPRVVRLLAMLAFFWGLEIRYGIRVSQMAGGAGHASVCATPELSLAVRDCCGLLFAQRTAAKADELTCGLLAPASPFPLAMWARALQVAPGDIVRRVAETARASAAPWLADIDALEMELSEEQIRKALSLRNAAAPASKTS
jgi:hypothetical protein